MNNLRQYRNSQKWTNSFNKQLCVFTKIRPIVRFLTTEKKKSDPLTQAIPYSFLGVFFRIRTNDEVPQFRKLDMKNKKQ